jgi:hypothetical protein
VSQTKAQLLDGSVVSVAFSAGTAGAPSLTFTGDSNTGIYSPGADQVAISTGGTGRLFVSSAGRVGVGAVSTDFPFAVSNTASDSSIGIAAANTANSEIFFGDTDSLYSGRIRYGHSSDSMQLWTNSAERLRITSAGDLCFGSQVGANNDGSGISIYNANYPRLSFRNSATGNTLADGTQLYLADDDFYITNNDNADIIARTNATERVRIDSTGRVGIGTSSVSELLQVSKTGGANIQVDSGSSNVVAKFGASGAGAFVGSTSNDYFQIYSNNTARIHVTSAGLVGIGTAVPGVALDVSGSIRSNNTISYEDGTVRNVLSSNGTSGILGTTTNHPVIFFANNGEAARIDSSRRLLVGTSSSYANADVDELQIGNNSSATKTGITLGSTDQSGIAFADASNARAGLIEYTHSIDSLRFYTNGTNERFRISSTGAQSSVIPGGSTLYPDFGCRAWVNFNGTGTVAIRGSGNVSSITDNGLGDYIVNFTTAMADANYSAVVSRAMTTDISQFVQVVNTQTTSAMRILNTNPGVNNYDSALVSVSVFR